MPLPCETVLKLPAAFKDCRVHVLYFLPKTNKLTLYPGRPDKLGGVKYDDGEEQKSGLMGETFVSGP